MKTKIPKFELTNSGIGKYFLLTKADNIRYQY